jgi:hypothetical protein
MRGEVTRTPPLSPPFVDTLRTNPLRCPRVPGRLDREMRNPLLFLGVLAAMLATPSVSHADEKTVCLDATERGQSLRASHQLVEARRQFLVCARPQCPAIVQQTCGGWVAEVDKSLPTVVIAAKDSAGADLVDVTVTVDGQPLVTKLDGEAVLVNPGRHVFHFSTASGAQLDYPAVIKEGQRNQSVAVALGKTANAASSSGGTWRTVGWVVGGVGVAGLLIGAISGAVAVADNSSAHCDATGHDCLAGPLSSARGAAVGSDVGFIAGGILLAGGAALVLLGPKEGSEGHGASVSVAPSVGPGGAGLALGGRF